MSASRPWSRPETPCPRSTRDWTYAPWCPTSRSTSGCPPATTRPPRGWSLSSAAPSGTCSPISGRPSWPGCGTACGPGDFFLLGTDLVKDQATLIAAYDDASGVTADFNKNVLAVLNAELGADFDRDEFEHVAVWDAKAEWIEMRLRSVTAQTVHLPGIGLTVDFAAGEEMRTEVSAKFRPEGVAAELAAAGFAMRSWWTDPAARFGLSLSVPSL